MSVVVSLRLVVVALVAAMMTSAIAVASNGSLPAALVFVLGLLVVWGVARLPLEALAAALFTVALLFYNPGGRPMVDAWRGPLYGVGEVLFNNLRLVVGVGFLRFALLEVLILAVAVVAAARLIGPLGEREPTAANPLRLALLVSLVALGGAIAWGMLRGGDFRQMLWQTRQLGWTPVIAAAFMVAFRSAALAKRIGIIILLVTLVRSLEGIYFYFAIMQPRGLDLPYLITHEDSLLFATSLIMLLGLVLEGPSRRVVGLSLALLPVLTFALVHNQRRLAYVSISWCVMALIWLLRAPLRRQVLGILLALSPLLAAYVAAGWSSRATIFALISALRSVDDEDNASNETRDVENYNLVQTLATSPIVGTGFGHPYREVRTSYSIEHIMANYRYVAHNSVLALWSLTGLVGFTLIWLPMPVAVFLAVRVWRHARDVIERVAALTSVGVVIAFLVQSYGDMGAMGGWMGAFLLAACYAVVGNLALRTRAWPA